MNSHQTFIELVETMNKELILPLHDFVMFKDYPDYLKERCMFSDELLELYSEEHDYF